MDLGQKQGQTSSYGGTTLSNLMSIKNRMYKLCSEKRIVFTVRGILSTLYMVNGAHKKQVTKANIRSHTVREMEKPQKKHHTQKSQELNSFPAGGYEE